VKVVSIEARDVDVVLREPFGIAGGTAAVAELVLVRVVLEDGTEGWGEAAPFPAYNGETRAMARSGVEEAARRCVGTDAEVVQIARQLAVPEKIAASARCAVETAVLDATMRRAQVPLWRHFGGAGSTVRTDCTITTGTPEAAGDAAARIAAEGFEVIKVKVGGVARAIDSARLEAITIRAPGVPLLLDGNGGLRVVDAMALVMVVRGMGSDVTAFEQPVPRDALDALREVHERAGVPVIADESAESVEDVERIAAAGAAQAINIKTMKSGLIEALQMAGTARAAGLGLMIGGMVESPLSMTVSASIAAGLGAFDHVDLDTPYWMIDPPFTGGARWHGPAIDLSGIPAGHGVTPRE
jgi:L-alanine-DL-glutamate epimerase-like enolase superfamily enzyme